jgi:hypothetical protein
MDAKTPRTALFEHESGLKNWLIFKAKVVIASPLSTP